MLTLGLANTGCREQRSKLQVLSGGFSRSITKQQNKQEVGLSCRRLWLAVLSVEFVGCLGLMGRVATNKEEGPPVPGELQASYVCW